MKLSEIMSRNSPERMPKVLRDEEHQLQRQCVDWFAWQYPKLRGMLFAVPNGGYRSHLTAAKMKMEGVVAGVSDMILLDPMGGCPLLIEMKTAKGKQSLEQKEWQRTVEGYFQKYVVCHSLDEFRKEVDWFLCPWCILGKVE